MVGKHNIHNILRELRAIYSRLSLWQKLSVQTVGLTVLLFLLFRFSCLLFPLPAPKSYSQTIYAADSTLLCAYLTADDKWRLRSDPDRISPDMVKAILNKEDKWFYWHPGVNPVSISRALFSNLLSGARTSGASTLTMQLARMADPSPRTYLHKIKEIFRALQYEWRYSKKEILEMYLSYLPYGGNVEGVHAASYIFFDRPPDQLSLSQSVLLAIIPNRPNSLRLDRFSEEAEIARDKWIERFREKGVFPESLLNAAQEENIPSNRYSIDPKAPHLCYYLREKEPAKSEIWSTLQPSTQHTAEQLLRNHVNRVKGYGVSNGAVIILDNRTSEVVAYCGSADFNDVESEGQVNGIRAIRSPGSTLKPAVYALGFDMGIVSPKMKLLDVPSLFTGFAPENYDLTFHGQVTVREALSSSLNIPPVRLLQKITIDPFLDLLETGGFGTIKAKRQELGLSVVLGGCGVSLEELSRFYSTFARGGELHSLIYTKEDMGSVSQPTRLFSEGSAYLINDILSDLSRPDLPQEYIEDTRLPKVAWKTGTSYGKRDAWSIGYNPRFTIGVWMGNFDGHGAPELSGSVMAVPLLLDLFNAVDFDPQRKWFAQPPSVGQRVVCSETGLLPGAHCESRVSDLYLVNTSPLRTCDLYRKIYLSADRSMQYCPVCLPKSGYLSDWYPMYEPELALWFEANHISIKSPPIHNPDCESYFSGDGPRILSPSPDFDYLVEAGSGREILLQAASDPTISTHYWYVNDRYYQKAVPGEKVFFAPMPGKLKVTVMDDKGRKSEAVVQVEYY